MDIKKTLKDMRMCGAQIMQLTPRNAEGSAIYTLLIVDSPDSTQMQDLDELQTKWDKEGEML